MRARDEHGVSRVEAGMGDSEARAPDRSGIARPSAMLVPVVRFGESPVVFKHVDAVSGDVRL